MQMICKCAPYITLAFAVLTATHSLAAYVI